MFLLPIFAMHKETRNALLVIFILNIVIQMFFSLLFNQHNANAKKHPTEHTANAANSTINTDLLQELQNINNKLDIQNQLIADMTNSDITHADTRNAHNTQPTITPKLTETEIWEQKQALINDIDKYGMTMPLFLADPRLQSLPSRTQSEILSELARRLDSNEIDKKTFLPGYKQ